MTEKHWYYVKDDRQEGPIPERELQEMFNAGDLEPETLVWSESLKNWTPAEEIESFRKSYIPSPPPLSSKPTPVPSQKQENRVKIVNTSGQGKSTVIPDEIKRWNWGAFLLNWIWGIGNKTYISLLCLIPIVGIVMVFVLGAKGSKWAWQNKRWESIEHFRKVQRIWAWCGLVIVLIGIAISILIKK